MIETRKTHRCHGGTLGYYTHDSAATGTKMNFSLFLPPAAADGPVPYIVFLSGLTCTEDNFTTKAGACRHAAARGVAILAPDTSPRGDGVADDPAYDLGQGAGFYLDALREPWGRHFRMESYIMTDLLPLIESGFPVDPARKGICGHSMGGHGALTLFYRHRGVFASCSAFAPVVAPAQVPWGEKAFTAYLGPDRDAWAQHDACALVRATPDAPGLPPVLIDQGLDDPFLAEQLRPELFADACAAAGQALTLRRHPGYDHSYFFIQTFIDDHIDWHAARF
jgi:S-formylglutathione hydrolase